MQVILTPSLEECEKLEHFYQGRSSGMYELSDIIVSWQRRVQPASTGQAARDHRWADSSLFLGGGQRRCSPDPIPQEEQLSTHPPPSTADPPRTLCCFLCWDCSSNFPLLHRLSPYCFVKWLLPYDILLALKKILIAFFYFNLAFIILFIEI